MLDEDELRSLIDSKRQPETFVYDKSTDISSLSAFIIVWLSLSNFITFLYLVTHISITPFITLIILFIILLLSIKRTLK